ncbi:hypothetical protein PM082_002011 [Marasmius tenuissimus]|nr:hypothetical protein PM082_002011 [Marasmius tenuissimus]
MTLELPWIFNRGHSRFGQGSTEHNGRPDMNAPEVRSSVLVALLVALLRISLSDCSVDLAPPYGSPFKRWLFPSSNLYPSPPMSIETIPIIDFAQFGDGTSLESQEIAKKFYEACRDVGFAYLINTGIPQEKVNGMFEWSAKFFELPIEVKTKVSKPPEKYGGYSGIGMEQVSQMVFDPEELVAIRKGKSLDFKESFNVYDETCTAGLGLENTWLPEEVLPGFRESALDYCRSCRAFQMERLLPALSIGMGLDKGFFNEYHKDGANLLRLVHYPEAPAEVFESGEKGRIGAHTDYGTCTLLFQDDVGGLEVESPSEPGVFIPVPPIRGAAVFNISDLLMRWSNDTLKSTLHRVRALARSADDNGMTQKRFSIPYFIGADAKTIVDCIPGCWGPDKPKKYDPVNAAEYIDMRVRATYLK